MADSMDRPAENWMYPYVAAAVDFGGNISIKVGKASDTKVGYRIEPQLYFSSSDQRVLGFLDEFCEKHDLEPILRETSTSYKLEVNKRDDMKALLKLVQPYLISRHEEAEILTKNLLPGLELGKASSEEGFADLMEYVDQIREHTQASNPKYDEAYFREEWGL